MLAIAIPRVERVSMLAISEIGAASEKANGEAFNLGSGKGVSVLDITKKLIAQPLPAIKFSDYHELNKNLLILAKMIGNEKSAYL